MKRLHRLVCKGLDATATRWPDLELAYTWVRCAAHLLENESQCSIEWLRREYRVLLAQIAPYRKACVSSSPFLQEAAIQFWKVSHSYWRGLFRCYEYPNLPRTNNDLEHTFGSFRYHERRCTGRKVTSASTVIRGSVRLVALMGTRSKPPTAEQLRPRCVEAWRTLRQQLETCQETRRQQRRFRQNPEIYLAAIEEQLLRSTLPT